MERILSRRRSACELADKQVREAAAAGRFAEICPPPGQPCDGSRPRQVTLDDGETMTAVGRCPLHGTPHCPRHARQQVQARHRLLEAVGFGKRYWDPDIERVADVQARHRLERLLPQMSRLVENGYGVMVAGPVGTGKTHLLALVALAAAQQGVDPIVYLRSNTLVRRLREEDETLFSTVPLVLVDDMDAVDLSGYNLELIEGWTEERYAHRLATCIALNSSVVAEVPALGRLVDRWRAMMVVIEFSHTSQRQSATELFMRNALLRRAEDD